MCVCVCVLLTVGMASSWSKPTFTFSIRKMEAQNMKRNSTIYREETEDSDWRQSFGDRAVGSSTQIRPVSCSITCWRRCLSISYDISGLFAGLFFLKQKEAFSPLGQLQDLSCTLLFYYLKTIQKLFTFSSHFSLLIKNVSINSFKHFKYLCFAEQNWFVLWHKNVKIFMYISMTIFSSVLFAYIF